MFKTLKMTALSAIVGLGALAAVPATANADGLYLGFGSGGARFGMHLGDNGHVTRRHDDHRRYRHSRRAFRTCTPGEAVHKARRMGVRHARVRSVNRNVIRVHGRRYGYRINVVFARAPHCPVIR